MSTFVLTASTIASPAPPPPPGPKLDNISARILYIHNAERIAVGAPPLQWDFKLAADAAVYSQQLARIGRLIHAPRDGRGVVRENISEAYHGSAAEGLMRAWLNEKRNFVPGTYPNVSTTGSWRDISHYSQIIWPTTTYVGCGKARGVRWDYVVCRYSPGGNKDGKAVGTPSYHPNSGHSL